VPPEKAPKPRGELTPRVALFTYLLYLVSFFFPGFFGENFLANTLVHDLLLVIIIGSALNHYGVSISQLKFHRMASTEYLFAIATGALLIGLDIGLSWLSFGLIPEEIDQFSEFIESIKPANIGQMIVLGTEVLIITAVLEELIFRGIMFSGFRGFGFWPAAMLASFLSSVLYYVATLSLAMFLPALLLGLILCWVYEKTGNIIVVMLAQMIWNILFFLQVTGVVNLTL
jgi:membrane protease YdiL (CAAX protease family)